MPQIWKDGQLKSYVLNSLDEGKRAIDHFPVALEVKIRTFLKFVHRVRAGFDRAALQRADDATLNNMLSQVRVPDWHADIHQHAQTLSQQIFERLCEFFPTGPGQAHKTYISDATWAIRKERLRIRSELSRVKQETGAFSMRHAFQLWAADGGEFRPDYVSFVMLLRRVRMLQMASHDLAKQLTKSLRHDRTAALEQLAKQAGQLSPKDFMAALRGVGVQNKKKPSGIRPLPHLLNEQGQPVEMVEEMAAVWRKYFGEQEDGLETDFKTLFEHADHTVKRQVPVPEWDEIPTRPQVEAQFRRTAAGKAYFADQIPGDLLAKVPQRLAELYYTVFCKEAIFVQEAMIHKGGYLAAAHKKGSPCEVSNYRSLFVSSVIGKTLHSIMRSDIVHHFGHQRLPMQVGGLPGQGITQPVHSLHLFHQRALTKGWSMGVLFIDISNAFYRLVRQHITHVDKECRGVRALFEQLHLPEGSFEDFQSSLQQTPAIAGSGASPHLQAMFKEFYDLTWFIVKHDNCVIQTRRGSRPGDALADICFSYALTRILKGPLAKLVQLFPDIQLSWSGQNDPLPTDEAQFQLPPLMPIWADDIALAFDDPRPDGLLQKAETITSMILDTLTSTGLKPNLKSGKSELLLDLRGSGSQECRRKLCLRDNVMDVPSDYEPYRVNVVGSYRHLGTWLQVRGGLAKDASTKFAIAHRPLPNINTDFWESRHGAEDQNEILRKPDPVSYHFQCGSLEAAKSATALPAGGGVFATAQTSSYFAFWSKGAYMELQDDLA